MTDVRELLPLYALGVLEPAEQQVVERAIAGDPALAAELANYQDTASSLIAEPAPVVPDADIKAQLIASSGGGRFAGRAERLAAVYDVSVDRAHEILGLIERKRSWELPSPGIGLVHFDGGPKCATADCGFIRLAPGCSFPHHKHRGEELSVILCGHLRETSTGRLLGPGDELVMNATSEHDITCEGEEDCIFAARAFEGIEIGGRNPKAPRS